MKLPSADPTLRDILKRQLTHYRPAGASTTAEQVSRILHGRATLGETTVEAVAELLALHPRTLNRRLNAEGTNFRELRERARHMVASQLLLGTRIPVTEIALALGYGELSSFTHAFQRWTGQAPARWRESAQGRPMAPTVRPRDAQPVSSSA
jgi:AraC-like DNA-binding protein